MAEQALHVDPQPRQAEQSLDSMLQRLERERLGALQALVLSAAGAAACALLGIYALPLMFDFTSTGSSSGEITTFLGRPMREAGGVAVAVLIGWPLAWLGIGFWILRRYGLAARWRYISRFKAQVLNALCRAHFPSIRYEPGAGMDWRIFDGCGLFACSHSEYDSEDRFSGRWGSTDVAFAEAVARRRYKRWTLKGRETVTETYFQGLIFQADFHKHFHGTTRLLPHDAAVTRVAAERPAELEDPRFEALFDTYTSDQVEARYLLSTAMLERFSALHQRFPRLRARFHDETLLLLLPSRWDRFEPSLTRSARNRGQLDGFREDIEACLSVVDALNLNTRIWSKR